MQHTHNTSRSSSLSHSFGVFLFKWSGVLGALCLLVLATEQKAKACGAVPLPGMIQDVRIEINAHGKVGIKLVGTFRHYGLRKHQPSLKGFVHLNCPKQNKKRCLVQAKKMQSWLTAHPNQATCVSINAWVSFKVFQEGSASKAANARFLSMRRSKYSCSSFKYRQKFLAQQTKKMKMAKATKALAKSAKKTKAVAALKLSHQQTKPSR